MLAYGETRVLRLPDLALRALAGALAGCLVGCGTLATTDSGPVFYPGPPQRPRIQFLTQFAGAEDVEGKSSALMKFLVGDQASSRRMRKPTSVAAHDGVIYVADTGWDTVILMDLKQGIFDTIRDRGPGKLRVPVAIAIDERGNKFIADSGRSQVVQFNAKNEYVRAFGDPQKLRPTGVAIDDEFLYVVDRQEHRVEVLNRRSGRRVRTFGDFGEREGEFNIPTSISRDPSGNLFVTDVANFRIQEFDAEGEFVKSYGFLGDGPGTFARPKGTSIDRSGHLYTVDAAFENVQIWDTGNAHVLLAFGGPGVEGGDMYLPASVHVSYELTPYFEALVDPEFHLEHVILVANNYGPNKLAVYGFVQPKDPSRYVEAELPEDEEAEE